MTNFTITLPESFTVTSRGVSETFATAEFAHQLANAAMSGFQHTLKDATASALASAFDAAHPDHGLDGQALTAARKAFAASPDNADAIADEVRNLMLSRAAALRDGDEWAMRGASTDTDPLDFYRRAVVRDALKKAKESDAAKEYAAIPSDDQKARNEYLLALAARNADAVDRAAAALKALADAEKAERDSLSITF